jgi:thiamine transporter
MDMTNTNTKKIVTGAIMIALATVLSFIRIKWLPWGGSITLLSMFPIVIYSIKYGVKWGLGASFVFSLIQFIQGIIDGLFGWGLSTSMLIACIFLDYIFAFTVIGIAGMFHKRGLKGWVAGTIIALSARFAIHIVSGVVIWQAAGKLWEGFTTNNSWLYSFIYNGTFMLPEIVFTTLAAVAIFKFPQMKKLIIDEK